MALARNGLPWHGMASCVGLVASLVGHYHHLTTDSLPSPPLLPLPRQSMRRCRPLPSLLLLLLILSGTEADLRQFYVSPTLGDDGNDGSLEK